MNNEIFIGRFDKIEPKIEKIHSTKLTYDYKSIAEKKYFLLSVGDNFILDGKVYNLENMADIIRDENNYLVLTQRERELIAIKSNKLCNNIIVFEERFPFFDGIKFTDSAEKNLRALKKNLSLSKMIGLKDLNSLGYFYKKNSRKITKKIISKNNIDSLFFHLPFSGFQETFKLKEFRKDRKIFAIDFNSMYLSCMNEKYPHPDKFKFIEINLNLSDIEKNSLKNGIYNVTMKGAKCDFFKKHHYFKNTIQGISLPFEIKSNDSINAYLLKEEIEYLNSKFESIFIKNGYLFEKMIHPPLYEYGCKLYRKRTSTENLLIKNLYKFMITMLHSTGTKKYCKKVIFFNSDDLEKFIYENFFIKKEPTQSVNDFLEKLNNIPHFKIFKNKEEFILNHPDIHHANQLYSHSYITIARSRLKILKFMEDLCQILGVEICYVNTDSVHFSIPKENIDLFYHKFNDIINNELGGIKIEAIGSMAIWLDVGRYWIVDNNKVIKFKNSMFNKKGDQNNFNEKRKTYIFDGARIITKHLNLVNSFSYKSKLTKDDNLESIFLERYNLDEVSNISDRFLEKVKQELLQQELKYTIFNEIKNISFE